MMELGSCSWLACLLFLSVYASSLADSTPDVKLTPGDKFIPQRVVRDKTNGAIPLVPTPIINAAKTLTNPLSALPNVLPGLSQHSHPHRHRRHQHEKKHPNNSGSSSSSSSSSSSEDEEHKNDKKRKSPHHHRKHGERHGRRHGQSPMSDYYGNMPSSHKEYYGGHGNYKNNYGYEGRHGQHSGKYGQYPGKYGHYSKQHGEYESDRFNAGNMGPYSAGFQGAYPGKMYQTPYEQSYYRDIPVPDSKTSPVH